jgi:hypothetical protein
MASGKKKQAESDGWELANDGWELADDSWELANDGWELADESSEARDSLLSKAGDSIGTFIENAGNMVALGYVPHAAAAIQPGIDAVLSNHGAGYLNQRSGQSSSAPLGDAQSLPQISYLQQRDQNLMDAAKRAEENPTAAILGKAAGIATSAALPIGQAKAAQTWLQAATRGAGLGAGYGLLANPGDEIGQLSPQIGERVENAALGAGIGAAVPAGMALFNKGVGTASYLSNMLDPEDLAMVPKGGHGFGGERVIDEILEEARGNVPAFKEHVAGAAARLNIPTTPAMLTDDFIIRGMESSLENSPSIPGKIVNRKVGEARAATNRVTSQLVAEKTEATTYEIGKSVIDKMKDAILQKYEPIQQAYKNMQFHTQAIAIKEKSKTQVAKNIRTHAAQNFPRGSVQHTMVMDIADQVEAAVSVDTIKQIKTMLRNQIKAVDPRVRYGFSPIFDKLERLEKNSILRAAVEATSKQKEGIKLAKDLIASGKQTNKEFRALKQILEELGERSKISRARTVGEFIDDLDNMNVSKIGEKIWNSQDVDLLRLVQKEFPESFQLLRSEKLKEIFHNSQVNGEISTQKFLTIVNKLKPEQRQMIFGKQAGMIDDLKTVFYATPKPRAINQSGTSFARDFLNIINPAFQIQEAGRYQLYKRGSLPEVSRMTERLFQKTANPASVGSSRPSYTPAVPMLEGYRVTDLADLDDSQKNYFRDEISKNQGLDSIERAKMKKLLEVHGKLPIAYMESDNY